MYINTKYQPFSIITILNFSLLADITKCVKNINVATSITKSPTFRGIEMNRIPKQADQKYQLLLYNLCGIQVPKSWYDWIPSTHQRLVTSPFSIASIASQWISGSGSPSTHSVVCEPS